MSFTKEGLSTKTYDETLSDIISSEQEKVSPNIQVSDNTALGQLNKVFADEITSCNEAIQAVSDGRNVFAAEGKQLDDLLSALLLTRQQETATRGVQFFVGRDGTTITNAEIQNPATLSNFTTDQIVVITKDNCRQIEIELSELDGDSYTYEVVVSGIRSTHTSSSDDTAEIIIEALKDDINTKTNGNYIASVIDNEVLLIKDVDGLSRAVSFDSKLKAKQVTVQSDITCTNTGAIPAPANSVIKILTPKSGWFSTYNPNELIIGREVETDNEFRARAINLRSIAGKATEDAIKAAVGDVEGVSSVEISRRFVSDDTIDNYTITVDTVVDNSDYDITINGIRLAINSGGSASKTSIRDIIVNSVNSNLILSRVCYAVPDNDDVIINQLYRTAPLSVSTTFTSKMSVTEYIPRGALQIVVAGGSDSDEVAQAIWDTVGAADEIWAADDGTKINATAIDKYGESHIVSFNRPSSILITVNITYNVFNATDFPSSDDEANRLIADSVANFGNSQYNAGDDMYPSQFEGAVYGVVSGISNVVIEFTSSNGDASSYPASEHIVIGSTEEAVFDADLITVNRN